MDKSLHQIQIEAKTLPKGMLHSTKEPQFQKQIGHSVVNLTNLTFTENEIELLNTLLQTHIQYHNYGLISKDLREH